MKKTSFTVSQSVSRNALNDGENVKRLKCQARANEIPLPCFSRI